MTSRRRAAIAARALTRPPHVPTPDPAAPGCCTCGLPTDRPNQHHTDTYPPVDPAAAEVEARRLGEKEDR